MRTNLEKLLSQGKLNGKFSANLSCERTKILCLENIEGEGIKIDHCWCHKWDVTEPIPDNCRISFWGTIKSYRRPNKTLDYAISEIREVRCL
jgi:hypothetical protein